MEIVASVFGLFIVVAFFAISVFILFKIYKENVNLFKKIIHYLFIFIFFAIFSIIFIILGFRAVERNENAKYRDSASVLTIWGGEIIQNPPVCYYLKKRIVKEKVKDSVTGDVKEIDKVVYDKKYLKIIDNHIKANLKENLRKKGLLTYNGYDLSFTASYVITNPLLENKKVYFDFPIPERSGNLTDFTIKENAELYKKDQDVSDGINWSKELNPRDKITLEVKYKARGTSSFYYSIGNKKTEHTSFNMDIITNFKDIDFPNNTMSPSETIPVESGLGNEYTISYKFNNLITTQDIGIIIPEKTNDGSIIGRILLFSPLALFFFLIVFLISERALRLELHTIHYLLILSGFGIFYILLLYLVDYAGFIASFAASLALSIVVLSAYVWLVKKVGYLVLYTLFACFMFQGFFSIGFYFTPHTGLIITIAVILTVIGIMLASSKIDWKGKF